MRTIYAYRNCNTCRKALKWLDEKGLEYEEKAIRETPPSTTELRTAVKYFSGDLRRLFNTSGTDYRDLGMKSRLSTLSEEEAITLLAENGNLVKRPFLIMDGKVLTGFKPEIWQNALL
jgi:arsenate reductase